MSLLSYKTLRLPTQLSGPSDKPTNSCSCFALAYENRVPGYPVPGYPKYPGTPGGDRLPGYTGITRHWEDLLEVPDVGPTTPVRPLLLELRYKSPLPGYMYPCTPGTKLYTGARYPGRVPGYPNVLGSVWTLSLIHI
eukprot:2542608-Rhodomonas_salina.1